MGIACVVRKKIHFFAKPLGFHHALERGMCPPLSPRPRMHPAPRARRRTPGCALHACMGGRGGAHARRIKKAGCDTCQFSSHSYPIHTPSPPWPIMERACVPVA